MVGCLVLIFPPAFETQNVLLQCVAEHRSSTAALFTKEENPSGLLLADCQRPKPQRIETAVATLFTCIVLCLFSS